MKRNRHNRIISALVAKPEYIGVGIDESTAIIVKGNKAFIAGDSQVLRLISPKYTKPSTNGLLRFEQIDVAGDVLILNFRTAE